MCAHIKMFVSFRFHFTCVATARENACEKDRFFVVVIFLIAYLAIVCFLFAIFFSLCYENKVLLLIFIISRLFVHFFLFVVLFAPSSWPIVRSFKTMSTMMMITEWKTTNSNQMGKSGEINLSKSHVSVPRSNACAT